MAFTFHYLERVRAILLAHDIHGITFRDLNQKVRTPNYDSADLEKVINSWIQREWVDKFVLPSRRKYGTKPKTLYRGTTKLVSEWGIHLTAVEHLLLGPRLPLEQDRVLSGTSLPEE
jgi:hypothetical protein